MTVNKKDGTNVTRPITQKNILQNGIKMKRKEKCEYILYRSKYETFHQNKNSSITPVAFDVYSQK